jgi:hypothetical protein
MASNERAKIKKDMKRFLKAFPQPSLLSQICPHSGNQGWPCVLKHFTSQIDDFRSKKIAGTQACLS